MGGATTYSGKVLLILELKQFEAPTVISLYHHFGLNCRKGILMFR